MVIEECDERFDIVIGSLCQLIAAMKNESVSRSLRQRGRPEINIGEEQLASVQKISVPCLDVVEQ